ncbi:MAG: class I SAM-dependent methyltransferase [Kiritimatiellia bacterium]
MASIVDDRGYNQGFIPTKALERRTERRLQALIREMDFSHPKAILELGCGTGELADLLAARTPGQVTGTDICEPFVRSAREKFSRANLSFQIADLSRNDLPRQLGRTYDYVVGNGILHHLYYGLPEILPRLKSILNPQGRLIFWEPNLFNPYVFLIFTFPKMRAWARLEPGEMAFTRRGLGATFFQAGFTHVQISCRDFLVPNTPDALIKPVIALGDLAERIPLVKNLAQSLFISAAV